MTVTPAPSRTLDAIHTHHAHLAAAVDDRARQLHEAADRQGELLPVRDNLAQLLRLEVLPHAAAEEATLYVAGAAGYRTGLLVHAMTDEHRLLEALTRDLASAPTLLRAAELAHTIQTLFEAHLAKENDLLLPALVADGIDLDAILAGMHDILGGPTPEVAIATTPDSCGCGGCGCGS